MNLRRLKLGLELTSKCNLRCGMCPLPVLRRPYEDMPWELVEKSEREIHGLGLKLKWLHEMGEPLLYARIDDATEYLGTLKSLHSTTVQPQIDGQITQINVKSGDRVEMGAPLMQIDPRRQQAAVSSQEAERTSREASVNYARQQQRRMSELFEQRVVSRQEPDKRDQQD